MGKEQQVIIQHKKPRFTPIPVEEPRMSGLEQLFRKTSLAAMTMLGIGQILVNAPVAILIGYSVSTIPIASQADVEAIAGRILFLIASSISIALGLLIIFGAVQFYERSRVRGLTFLGISLGSFYLLCLGTGSTLLLSETNAAALALTMAPLVAVTGAALYTSSSSRLRLAGSIVGILGGVAMAYSILNLRVLDLVFGWDIPFTGPLLALPILEGVAVVMAPIAATAYTVSSMTGNERPVQQVFPLLVALVYGLGAFIGSLVLSMSFWNWIWKSAWIGPFHGLPEWFINMIVFWSASLVLIDIGGILLVAVACLGFTCVARELSRP